mmetsp:Transcript_35532/g.113553  ORF Transcript_35532/g.113553 Transcript_35532/m.113553 type:complete len:91 (-) Transcript_35532:1819-2091(-)
MHAEFCSRRILNFAALLTFAARSFELFCSVVAVASATFLLLDYYYYCQYDDDDDTTTPQNKKANLVLLLLQHETRDLHHADGWCEKSFEY